MTGRLAAIGLVCAVVAFGAAFGVARALGGHSAPHAPRARTVAAATPAPDRSLAARFRAQPAALRLPPPKPHRRAHHARSAPAPAPSVVASAPSPPITTATATTPAPVPAPVPAAPVTPVVSHPAHRAGSHHSSGSGSGTTVIP